MLIQIFAIHDAKAHAYLTPFFLLNKEMAIRNFTGAVTNEDSIFNAHPLDYTLFHLGSYDDETSLIQSLAPPEMLITASQAIAQYSIQQDQLDKIQSIQKHQEQKSNEK